MISNYDQFFTQLKISVDEIIREISLKVRGNNYKKWFVERIVREFKNCGFYEVIGDSVWQYLELDVSEMGGVPDESIESYIDKNLVISSIIEIVEKYITWDKSKAKDVLLDQLRDISL